VYSSVSIEQTTMPEESPPTRTRSPNCESFPFLYLMWDALGPLLCFGHLFPSSRTDHQWSSLRAKSRGDLSGKKLQALSQEFLAQARPASPLSDTVNCKSAEFDRRGRSTAPSFLESRKRLQRGIGTGVSIDWKPVGTLASKPCPCRSAASRYGSSAGLGSSLATVKPTNAVTAMRTVF
jgi:hypothetical protein